MIAADIARALGPSHRSGAWWRCRCPVHSSHGATLALRDGDLTLIVKCWAGCDARDVFAALRRIGLIAGKRDDACPHAAEIPCRHAAEATDRQRRIALGRDIIGASLRAEGTPVEGHLQARGITILPPAIRYLPMGDPYARHSSGSRRPVMVAAVEHVEQGIVAAHRTWVTTDGSTKAGLDPVRIMTGPVRGGAVWLAPAADTLMVGEGIETCLAAMTATGMSTWAALSTSGLVTLVLPPIVRHVVILADNDVNGAGQRAAYTAAQRWIAEGRRVRIAMPAHPGTDFNDVLNGSAPVCAQEAPGVAA